MGFVVWDLKNLIWPLSPRLSSFSPHHEQVLSSFFIDLMRSLSYLVEILLNLHWISWVPLENDFNRLDQRSFKAFCSQFRQNQRLTTSLPLQHSKLSSQVQVEHNPNMDWPMDTPTQKNKEKFWLQTGLEQYFLTHYVKNYKTINVYYTNM